MDEIPGFKDKLGHYSFKHSSHYFTVSNPDIRNRNGHTFTIHLVSENLRLLNTLNDYLIISIGENEDESHNVCMIRLDESMSISKYK